MIIKILGAFLFIFGVFFISLSFTNITGNVVSEFYGNASGFVGLISIIAGIFMMTLNSSLEKKVSGTTLSKGERERIKSAFRGWNGRLTGAQKKILKQYGLQNKINGTSHHQFYFPDASNSISLSFSPGDYRTGLNFALQELIPYIESNYRD
jgi:hypothetical protein